MGNCNSTRCGRQGEVIEPVQRSNSWSGGHQTGQKATNFGETTIEDRPINEQVVIYDENEINDRIARLETLKVERFVYFFTGVPGWTPAGHLSGYIHLRFHGKHFSAIS